MGEVPVGSEWADCQACDVLMEEIGEPSTDDIPVEVVYKSRLTFGGE